MSRRHDTTSETFVPLAQSQDCGLEQLLRQRSSGHIFRYMRVA